MLAAGFADQDHGDIIDNEIDPFDDRDDLDSDNDFEDDVEDPFC